MNILARMSEVTMGKKAGSYRQIVSIPADLKRRMEKVADQVNWSAVAAKAFEQKLGEIAAAREKKDMSDVVQRLRASKLQLEGEIFKEGVEAGKAWAEHTAEARDLINLENLETQAGRDWDRWFDAAESGGSGAASLLADAITGERLDRREFTEFWEVAIGEDDSRFRHADFVRGFAEGALNIWADVKAQL